MDRIETTSFTIIYDSFLARISEEMFLEITEFETLQCMQDLLINAIPRFEFPRFDIFDYELGYLDENQKYKGIESGGEEVQATMWIGGQFNSKLTEEEINILALGMVIEWLGQQLETTENTRLKFAGSDFKFSSQANHMSKLKVLIDAKKTDMFHLQRLYKRRLRTKAGMISTMGQVVATPEYGIKNPANAYNGVSAFWSRGRI